MLIENAKELQYITYYAAENGAQRRTSEVFLEFEKFHRFSLEQNYSIELLYVCFIKTSNWKKDVLRF